MTGIPHELALRFVTERKWRKAFETIVDESPILVASMPERSWITREGEKHVSDRPFLAYCFVTVGGLHVPTLGERGRYVDHFLPRHEITAAVHDGRDTAWFDGKDGRRVALTFHDPYSILTIDRGMRLSALDQARVVADQLGQAFEHCTRSSVTRRR